MCATAVMTVPVAQADAVVDWNKTSIDIIDDAIKSSAVANRAVALGQTSVYTAVNSITQRYPASEATVNADSDSSVDAAIAAANNVILSKLLPKSEAMIDETYQKALDNIPDGQARTDGIAAGEQAASAVLALRKDDKIGVPESYRPKTTPVVYVPTVTPVASTWGANRLPWHFKQCCGRLQQADTAKT